MTVSTSFLPSLVAIPAGVFNGAAIEAFRLGRTPVTNAQYAAHADRFSDTPFVLLATSPDTQATSLVGRGETPQDLLGNLAERPRRWNTRDPLIFGALTLFKLRKDMSPKDFNRPNQPVVNMSWYHAFEYCVGNGFFLPSDDQWSYAAGVHAGRMTSEVWEWTARNDAEKSPYGLRGGSWGGGLPEFFRISNGFPVNRDFNVGFRVGAPAPPLQNVPHIVRFPS